MSFPRPSKQLIGLMLLYLVGLIFFASTDPQELPLLLLVIPFIYIFVTAYLTILIICRSLKLNNPVLVSVVISLFGVLLLVLGSLHQLTLRDIIISIVLTGMLTWYIVRLGDQRSR